MRYSGAKASAFLLALCFAALFNLYAGPATAAPKLMPRLAGPTDSLHLLQLCNIAIVGNCQTKAVVIVNELAFDPNQGFPANQLQQRLVQSQANLLNTSLFNFVDISYRTEPDCGVALTITVEERWYWWPEFKLQQADRNFSNWIKRKDWDDIRLGAGIAKYNFRGRKETLSIGAEAGYEEKLQLNYTDFTIGPSRKHIITAYGGYYRRHDLFHRLADNRLHQIELAQTYAYQNMELLLTYTYRQTLYAKHRIGVFAHSATVADTILLISPNYFPGNRKHAAYFELDYNWSYKKRDSKHYPLRGSMATLSLLANLFATGELFPQLNVEYYKYVPLDYKLYAAIKVAGQKSLNMHRPMVIRGGLGFEEDLLYGYEHYVIEGQDFAYAKTALKRELVSARVIHLPWLPIKQLNKVPYALYANVFADLGFTKDYSRKHKQFNNSLSGNFLYSFGAGLDFVTYYDKVVKVNIAHTRLGKTGVFVHFKTYL